MCIKGESNPRRVDGNDPGYHYPINAFFYSPLQNLYMVLVPKFINVKVASRGGMRLPRSA